MRIGVDVGGTNTDAVLMHGGELLAYAKSPTTMPARDGIAQSVQAILKSADAKPSSVRVAMIGTTQITNALTEGRRLAQTAVLRLCLPANKSVRPMTDWPDELKQAIGENVYWASGGLDFNGTPYSELCEDEIRRIAIDMRLNRFVNVAIVGVFSPVNGAFEERAGEIILDEYPEVHVTLSKDVGRLGFIERENAAILNASLSSVAHTTVHGFIEALQSVGVDAPIFVSQNDGTLMSAEYAQRYPILMTSSGPTNSMHGAAHLSGLSEAVVIDVGGTSTDVGLLINGRPREHVFNQETHGVRTNFRMPAIRSIGLGGGSRVDLAGDTRIGPESVARDLQRRSLVFGGDVLTVTDIAVAAGRLNIGDPGLVANLPKDKVEQADRRIREMIETEIEKAKLTPAPALIVLVGGGASLISPDLKGAKDVRIPQHFEVANAIGAAIARIGAETDMILSYSEGGREHAIERVREETFRRAIEAGAAPDTLQTVILDEIPLAYLTDDSVRIKMKVVGDLQI